MSNPFVIQPWDTPSDQALFFVRVCDVVVHSQQTWRAAFCQRSWLPSSPAGYHFLLQKESAPLLEAIWEVSSPLALASRFCMGMKVFGFWASPEATAERDREDLSSTGQETLSEQHFSRVFYLNTQGKPRQKGELSNLQLRLSNQGWGSWDYAPVSTQSSLLNFGPDEGWLPEFGQVHLAQYFGHGVLFYYEPTSVERFLDLPSPDLLRDFSTQLADETSDAAFAFRLAKEKTHDFNAHIWKWKNGDLKTFFEVLTLAFVGENDFWETRKDFYWQIQLPGYQDINALDGGKIFRVGKNPALRNSSPQLQDAYKRVLDWFEPTLDEEALQRHLCLARHYAGQEGSWDYRKPFFMSIQNPTEARRQKLLIQWCNWLDMTS